ncbi:G-type lectin S-receptor-like serine/threonine-protein kinase LECRK1 [Abrus precatorius]|uniref:Receptor-like serine/threonine-protein kinase n=1 Tax=Abrus precatorius TaxID=3816 RepID=A0A8B8JS83_ABRPR|nr:G-type lectin S-receptor-like serine/threonine-protein kinase LECRK1 [Abrus precatorius]
MVSWIPTTTFVLFMSLVSYSSTRAQTQPPKNIEPGSTLIANDPHHTLWYSPSGQFAFGFSPQQQSNGFIIAIWLAAIGSKTVVWTANRNDPPVSSNAKLQLTKDGKLVLTNEQGQEKVIAPNGSAKASFASMLDSGNFVLYNNDSKSSIIWQSFDYPTDTLLGGQSLSNGHELVSSSSHDSYSFGRFRLKMQDDGNLVLYPVNSTDTGVDAYWASNVFNIGFKSHLYLNKTGLLQIMNSSDSTVIMSLDTDSSLTNPIKNGDENQIIYRATLDVDGVFRLYAHSNNGFHIVKSWPGGDACSLKGICGFNSYCTFDEVQSVCNCLPGFDLIDPAEDTKGCKRNFSKIRCASEKDSLAYYNMISIRNVTWENHPYFVAKMSQEQECSLACLADCNCWAAIYQQGSCEKQGLPLRYIRMTRDNEPGTVVFLKVGNKSLKGNGNSVPEPPPPPLIKTTSNKATIEIIVITSLFSMLLCLAIAISCHYMYKIRVLRYQRLMETGNLGLNEEVTLRRFSYNELKRATNNFKQELGKGSFGAVYKGSLYKGKRLIAVKRLEKLVEEGEREFQAEMRAIGKTHHKNLVHLLGYCVEGSRRLLVYEYMTNDSLGKLIFGVERHLDLDERVRIALEIARGLLYLHEECEAPIIHCDIKPQNILMDEFWTAKISDFGLGKLLMPDQTRTFTGVRGTRGYLAPEWHKNTPISVKADVYSYGIVLLEILCCRRNIEVNVSKTEEVLLYDWAYKCFVAGQLNKLVLWEAMDKKILENMVKVALWCIQDEPVLRPTMKSVVLMLEGISDVAIPPYPNSNYM